VIGEGLPDVPCRLPKSRKAGSSYDRRANEANVLHNHVRADDALNVAGYAPPKARITGGGKQLYQRNS
jgi:hypothetical protein